VLSFVLIVFVFGAADRLYVLWGLSYDIQLYIFRIALVVIPPVVFLLARRICRELKRAEQIEKIREQAEEEAAAYERSLVSGRPAP
jgi:hypothetical protein